MVVVVAGSNSNNTSHHIIGIVDNALPCTMNSALCSGTKCTALMSPCTHSNDVVVADGGGGNNSGDYVVEFCLYFASCS